VYDIPASHGRKDAGPDGRCGSYGGDPGPHGHECKINQCCRYPYLFAMNVAVAIVVVVITINK
jgi:hypothetical protein